MGARCPASLVAQLGGLLSLHTWVLGGKRTLGSHALPQSLASGGFGDSVRWILGGGEGTGFCF